MFRTRNKDNQFTRRKRGPQVRMERICLKLPVKLEKILEGNGELFFVDMHTRTLIRRFDDHDPNSG